MNNQTLYDEVFYGKGDYRRWAGYSIGYHLVGKFIEENTETNWPSLMMAKTEAFLAVDL